MSVLMPVCNTAGRNSAQVAHKGGHTHTLRNKTCAKKPTEQQTEAREGDCKAMFCQSSLYCSQLEHIGIGDNTDTGSLAKQVMVRHDRQGRLMSFVLFED